MGKKRISPDPGKRRVSDLAPAPYNPRKISGDADARLARSMEAFGDLSGVIYNRRTGRLIGGHQRVRHMPEDAEISVAVGLDEPNAQGTVAVGHIVIDGERWLYREVDVDETTERAMNLAANRQGGEWDLPALSDVLSGLAEQDFDLDLTGFDQEEIERTLAWDQPPGADAWDNAINVPDGDRAPFRQMTFTLHDTQAEQVSAALTVSKALGPFVESENENSNGNALARICETFLAEHGDG